MSNDNRLGLLGESFVAMTMETVKKLITLGMFVCMFTGCGGGSQGNTGSGSQQNPAPTLTGMSPNASTAGVAAVTLTVTGTQFISNSQVLWNGTALSTTYGTSTSLQAQVPAVDLATAGLASVAVRNPTPGGGTSGTLTFTINQPLNPVPTVSSISPSSALTGSPGFTLAVTGTQFISGSQVLWNGSALSTTYGSSTSLQAQVPPADLLTAGTATVSVQNPTPGGGTSGTLNFTITSSPGTNLTVIDLDGNDAVWDPAQKHIYVSVPSAATSNGDTITVVDPVAGSIVSSQSLTSEPSILAISDDSQYLYAATAAGNTIQRFTLPGLTPDIQFDLGTDSSSGQPNDAADIKVEPSAAHTAAVSFGPYGAGQTVALFDDAVSRTNEASGPGVYLESLQWKSDGSEIFAEDTNSSDRGLTTLSVSSTGVSIVPPTGYLGETYSGAFRNVGYNLHSDPTTGYLYSDFGDIVNSATGLPVGNFEQVHASASYTSGTPRVIVDPALKRAYAVEEMNMGGGLVFQIQSFDLAHFNQLSTFVIPNPSGYPENFIRWGSSGLALITKTTVGLGAGKLYLIDGAFVNASGPADTTSGTTIAPVPTLSAVTPLNTTAGSSGVQITVTGWDFTGQSTLYWNGTALATNAVSTTEVQATLPASDLQSSTLASLTASNTAGQISNSLPFAVNPAPTSGNAIAVYNTGGNDLVWNNTAGKIYVSMPGIQGDLGNGIAIVDPVRGNVTTTNFLGSDPSQLSLSSDGQSLYVGFNGNNTVQQFTLPGFTQSQSWNLGADTFSGPFYALDLQADPWSPGTTAITKAAFNISPQSKGIFIYDNSIARPNSTTTFGGVFYTPQWAGGGSVIYALDQYGYNFLNLAVDSSGLSLSHSYGPTTGGNLHYDEGTNLVYTDGGEVINPSSGAIVGNFGASGIAVPDSALNRVFILGQLPSQSGTPDYTIQSFDQTGFTAVGSITIPNVVGRPTALILWGTNGLAFTTRFGAPYDYSPIGPGQLYVISGTFVNAAQSAVSTTSKAPTVMVQRTWGLAPRSAAHTVHK